MIPTRYINAGPMAAAANPQAGQAAGQATEAVGKGLMQVGGLGSELATKIRKVEEGGKINAFMADAAKQANDFSLGLARRSDTEAWSGEWQEKQSALLEQGRALGLSPDGMAHLEGRFTNWGTQQGIQFQTQAVTKELGIARARTTQSLQYHAARGDKDEFEATLTTAAASGTLNPAEVEKARMHFAETAAGTALQGMVETAPEALQDMDVEEILKQQPGATLEMAERAKGAAKSAVKERAFGTIEAAQDDIYSGKITTTDMIDQDPRYAGLRPTVREKLKDSLRSYQIEKQQGLMNTPEAQAGVVGAVSSRLGKWEPKASEEADTEYAEIQGMIARLPEGSMRTELARQAKAIRTGAWAESTSHADAAMKAIDAAAKDGRMGKVPDYKPMLTSDAVEAGFLSDPAKMKQVGFSEDQFALMEKEKTNTGKLRVFREQWEHRGKADEAVPQTVWQTAMSIRTGANQVENPEAEDARISAQMDQERKVGDAKMKLHDFLKVNPKATRTEIDDKILEISGEETHRALKSGIYDGGGGGTPKPGAFVPGETSLNLPAPLAPLRSAFVEEGLRYGVDPRFLAAVSMHETGNGTSSAYKDKRNAMGVSNSSGPIAFDNTRESIARMARLLGSSTGGPYKAAKTIGEIAGIYAPVGAENDPGNLNGHWAAGVSKYFKQLGGNPAIAIK